MKVSESFDLPLLMTSLSFSKYPLILLRTCGKDKGWADTASESSSETVAEPSKESATERPPTKAEEFYDLLEDQIEKKIYLPHRNFLSIHSKSFDNW